MKWSSIVDWLLVLTYIVVSHNMLLCMYTTSTCDDHVIVCLLRCQLCSHRHKVHKFTRVWNTDLCDLCLKLNYMQHSFIEHFMVSSGHAHCGTHLCGVCVCVCVCVCVLCVCVCVCVCGVCGLCVSQCTSFRALASLFEVYSTCQLLCTSSKL